MVNLILKLKLSVLLKLHSFILLLQILKSSIIVKSE